MAPLISMVAAEMIVCPSATSRGSNSALVRAFESHQCGGKGKSDEEPLRWPDGRVAVKENTVKLFDRGWERHILLA
jgi:hypothetical protein